jgi:hypothetical protein
LEKGRSNEEAASKRPPEATKGHQKPPTFEFLKGEKSNEPETLDGSIQNKVKNQMKAERSK